MALAPATLAEAGDSRHELLLIGTIKALVALVQARDRYTGQYNDDVAKLTVRLARHLQLDPARTRLAKIGGRLHDVGKVAVPDVVPRKPGMLSANEWAVMRTHPIVRAQVISYIATLREVAPLIRGHHERWDGGGYPDGLAGEAIPLGARIVAVADAFGASTTNRPYRDGCKSVLALAELRRHSGTQFDPGVVAALGQLLAVSAERTTDAARIEPFVAS